MGKHRPFAHYAKAPHHFVASVRRDITSSRDTWLRFVDLLHSQ
jgi:hypothetical protein